MKHVGKVASIKKKIFYLTGHFFSYGTKYWLSQQLQTRIGIFQYTLTRLVNTLQFKLYHWHIKLDTEYIINILI